MDPRQRCREVVAINRAIAGAEDYDEVLRLVVERTAAFARASACALLLTQEDGLARVVRSVGIDPAKAARLAVPLTERIDRELCSLLGFRSPDRFVGVPVIGRAGLVGILVVHWEEARALDAEDDVELLSAFADQAAIALDNAERIRRVRASEGKLAGIIAIAADAIISVDEAQTIVMFNEGAEKIFGWSRDEVVGRPLEVLLPERFRASHRQHVPGFGAAPEAARRMTPNRRPIVGLRRSGEEFPADAAISKLRDGGQWIYTVVLRDVTEQARVEAEQRFLADVGLVLATSLDYDETLRRIAALAVRDLADLCIVESLGDDDAMRRLEVVSRDPSKRWLCELFTRIPLDRRRPHLLRSVHETMRPFVLQRPSAEEIAALAQSEEHHRALRAAEIHSMVAVPLVARARLVGAMALVSSTPSRLYGPADVRLAEELAHRAALSIESARLYRVARLATQARDDVLGVVAHDLRNPLNSIVMQATLIQRCWSDPEVQAQKPAEVIARAATRMNRLIQDLLDVTRLEAGQLSVVPARVRARELVADTIEVQAPVAAAASLGLRGEVAPDLPEVWADRDRLLQVLENLLGNAIKFTPPGGEVTVGAAPGDGDVVFWVRDTGPGIAGADLPHLFDRFWQAHRSERRGVGLGLAIVKGLVEAHHGRVWVESAPGEGSTFYFSVPAAPRPRAPGPAKPPG